MLLSTNEFVLFVILTQVWIRIPSHTLQIDHPLMSDSPYLYGVIQMSHITNSKCAYTFWIGAITNSERKSDTTNSNRL